MANDAKYGTEDFATYFPTQVMETGWDIIFFWVARMVLFSYYRTNQPPFAKVYLHGLVRDKDRQKMSKSKGNVVDPLGVIDAYGADALRFALIFSTAAGNDIPLAEEKINGMKHFANKLWNIARYVLATAPSPIRGGIEGAVSSASEAKTEADKAILTKLASAVKDITNNLENFRLHEAAQTIYDFTWHEFADVYIEASKKQLADETLKDFTGDILYFVLATVLKFLHPFMPFVTEAIWREMHGTEKEKLLMIQKWPMAKF